MTWTCRQRRCGLRAKGGHGGHNGMRSIVSQLGGNKDFPRIRIGVCLWSPASYHCMVGSKVPQYALSQLQDMPAALQG